MCINRLLITVLASLLGVFFPASACDFDDEDGLDIALVLSGGGAFTTTQVGAMTLIEELGVPIHCVLGTSMGSVTGAMYAGGYSAEEIADIYRDRDWAAIFRGGVSRNEKPYLQKENEDQYFSDYVAGLGPNGITLPGGFGDMSGLQAEFRKLFSHLSNDIDFSTDLRVPYRAVAMDLSTGDAKAFADGDVVQSILASMAVPGVFSPREIDDRLYVDGGMASQLPVRIAKEMGADIVIALDTTVEPPELSGAQSIASASQQIVRITVYRNWLDDIANLTEDDLLLQPSLEGLSTASFNRAEQGLASGRKEAEAFRDRLLAIRAKAAPLRDQILDPSVPFDGGDELLLVNASPVGDSIILDRLDYEAGDIDEDQSIDTRLRNLASFGAFGDVDLSRSRTGPLLTVAPRALGRNLLQAGLRASTTFDGDAQYSLLGRISRRPVNRFGGEASLSLEVGTDFGATLQYYQPFGASGRFFFIPVLSYRGEEILFDIADTRLAEFFEQRGDFRVRFGRELGDWGIVSVESVITAGRIEPQLSIAPDVFIPNNFQQGGLGIFFGADTLNRSVWPTSGYRLLTSVETLFDFDGGEDTEKFNLFGTAAFELGALGFQVRGQFESVQEPNNEPVEILDLGGFRRLSAFTESSIPNNEYLLVTGEVFHRLTSTDAIVNFPVYVGATLEYANAEFDIFTQGLNEDIFSGSVYLGAETILGPAFLGTGFSDEGDFALFLHFGRAF
ncbi:MAG: patatin-like phospholipase family protein [Pseudomonadota bacterium]